MVPDAHADPRFADNPLVTGEPFIRFYAGMPLHGREGYRIGTLCIIDRQPRSFTAEDEAALADLAAWAELELNLDTLEKATALARERQDRLQAIFDHAGDALVTLSARGAIESFNPAAVRLFGGGAADSRGGAPSVLDWVAPASRGDVAATLVPGAPGQGGTVRREVLCRDAGGREFPAEITVTPTHGTAGSGYTLLVRDVSERKKVEVMKNEFISTVSHELRTPLTSVRGSLGLVLGGAAGEIPTRARALLEIAASNCDRLVRLVNDMLDIEKIESGHMRFEVSAQALLPLVRGAIAATGSFAQGMGVRYGLQPGGEDAQALVDADRITQVLVNLLSNAAKFSPAGGTVDVRLEAVAAPSPRVRLVVADRGPGIPPDFRDRLFTRFVQADGSDARSKPGTGLGLAISKAIVERLGGRIGFGDRDGGGTEFWVDLPAVDTRLPAARPGATVLVCEDDADIARLVALMLRHGGLQSDVVRTAADARRRLATRAYQAMTLDLGLPDEDGLSLLRWIRSQPGTAQLPVVVLTARDAPDGVGAAAFGAADWLHKPIDERRLLAALHAAMRGPAGERPVLLHVEDDADLVEVVRAMLEGSADTQQAATLAHARALLAERRYDLILLDMLLPDGHGAELLGSLPAPNAATPVVIFSGDEVSGEVATRVSNALVKSRSGTDQLIALLQRLAGVEGQA